MRLKSLALTLLIFGLTALTADLAAAPEIGAVAIEGKVAKKLPPAGTIEFREKAVVEGRDILLCNVADVNGFTSEERERIGNLVIASAPKPGRTRSFSKRYLRKLLKAHVGLGAWRIPKSVSVERGSRAVGRKEIKELFAETIGQYLRLPREKVDVTRINMKDSLLIPSGNCEIVMSFPSGASFRGLATAKISVTVNRKHYRDFYVTGKVKIRGRALRVAEPVKKGDAISSADLETVETVITERPRNIITDPGDAVGMIAAMTMHRGEWLTESHIDAPMLVRRGGLVNLVAAAEGLRVEAKGLAVESGKRNQVIRVKNISSEKIIYGRVISPDEVQVNF